MRTLAPLAIFAILEALQVLIITAHIYSFIPIHWPGPVPKGLEPERESFLYLIFLCAALVLMAAAFVFVRPQLEDRSKRRGWMHFLAVEALWLTLMLFAFFKGLTYRYPFYNVLPYENGRWVGPFFYGVVALSILSKVFWPEIRRFFDGFYPQWLAFTPSVCQRRAAGAAFAAFIFVLLLPNGGDVSALSYVWDQFNHWDDFFLSRWCLLRGMGPSRMVFLLFVGVMIFWTALFFIVEEWLKSFWLAAFAVLLGVKLTLFHYGMAPAAWLFPQAILRPGVDIASWQGLGNVPMYDALRVREFFSFFMGFSLPVFYVFTLLSVRNTVTTMIAAYGLLTYTNYIAHPELFSYGAVAVPAVLLLCFWLDHLVGRFFPRIRKLVFAALALTALGALLTNRLFVTYPHAINMYGQDFSKERQFLEKSLDLTADAALIDAALKASEPAAVIGSFELPLLRQAGHPAFFKHAPLIMSTFLGSPSVRGLRLKTKDDLLDTIDQLEQAPPAHIFVEKKLFSLPQEFYQSPAGTAMLLSFVRDHYEPAEQGKYFTAWRRK